MATDPPCHPCPVCGGQLQWEAVPRHREPWEPVTFGPTEWRQLPHHCPPEAVEEWLRGALERGRQEAGQPFFTKVGGEP